MLTIAGIVVEVCVLNLHKAVRPSIASRGVPSR